MNVYDALTKREQQVLSYTEQQVICRLRHGDSVVCIAQSLGITRTRVQQIGERASRKLERQYDEINKEPLD